MTKRETLNQTALPETELIMLPLGKIYANDEQARKIFDEGKLHELAASIREQGLMNPIVVRADGNGHYKIVAGERRYRACMILKLPEVPTLVKQMNDESLTYQMIIENLQRQDITPLEEARAFQKAMDDFGLTSLQLAHKIGISQPHRITERLQLLHLKPDYQDYLAKGYLNPTQAYYLAKVPTEYQDRFWQMIRSGKADTNLLPAIAQGFIEAANQTEMFAECTLSAEEVNSIRTLEDHIDKMFGIASQFLGKDGEIDVLKKIDKSRAGVVADKLKHIARFMQMAEKKLRAPAAQQQVMDEMLAG